MEGGLFPFPLPFLSEKCRLLAGTFSTALGTELATSTGMIPSSGELSSISQCPLPYIIENEKRTAMNLCESSASCRRLFQACLSVFRQALMRGPEDARKMYSKDLCPPHIVTSCDVRQVIGVVAKALRAASAVEAAAGTVIFVLPPDVAEAQCLRSQCSVARNFYRSLGFGQLSPWPLACLLCL